MYSKSKSWFLTFYCKKNNNNIQNLTESYVLVLFFPEAAIWPLSAGMSPHCLPRFWALWPWPRMQGSVPPAPDGAPPHLPAPRGRAAGLLPLGPPAGSSGLARPFLSCRLSPGVEEALAPGGSPPRRLHRAPCTSVFHLAQKWLKHCPRHPCDNVIGLGARGRAVRDVPLSDGELSLPHSRMERGASQQCPYR